MSQIEIKIDGRVFKVGEDKIWNWYRVSVEGFTGCRMIINDNTNKSKNKCNFEHYSKLN